MKSRTLDSSVFLWGLSLLSLSFCMLFSLSHIFSLFIHAFIDINVLCSCCWLKDLERTQNSTSECLLRYLLLFYFLLSLTYLSLHHPLHFFDFCFPTSACIALSLSLYSLFIYFHLTPYVVKTKKKTTLITHTDSLSLFSQNSCTMSLKLTREFQDTM